MYPARTEFPFFFLVDSARCPIVCQQNDGTLHLTPPAEVDDVAEAAALASARGRFFGGAFAEIVDQVSRGLVGGAVCVNMGQDKFSGHAETGRLRIAAIGCDLPYSRG